MNFDPYLDSENPIDTTTISSHRNNQRTWGHNDPQVPTPSSRPINTHQVSDHNDNYLRPSLPQPQDMLSPHANLSYLETGQHPTQFNPTQCSSSGNSNQNINPSSSHIEQIPRNVLDDIGHIPLIESREPLFSILSNQSYQKIVPHLANKYHHAVSPYSFNTILLALLLGSVGVTFNELALFMGINTSEIVPPMVSESLKLRQELVQHPLVKMQINDGLFVDTKFQSQLKPNYVTFFKRFGDLYPVNFGNVNEALGRINGWVKDASRGLITRLLEPANINDMTKLILVNVIYFKANWKNPFDPHGQLPFRQASGLMTQVPAMFKTEQCQYVEDSNYQFVSIPYSNYHFVMDIILPKHNHSFPVSNLHTFLDTYLNHQKIAEVKITMPKFEQRCRQSLVNVLKKNKVTKIFNWSAELNNIARSNNGYRLFLSDIIQETVVKVDETGTEATAATASTVLRSYNAVPIKHEPIIFKADHTFQYMIRYQPTNTILFVGVFDGN